MKSVTRVLRSPVDLVCADGRKVFTERTVTTTTDIRETTIGPVDFGGVHMSTPKWKVEQPDGTVRDPHPGEVYFQTQAPKRWWEFWK